MKYSIIAIFLLFTGCPKSNKFAKGEVYEKQTLNTLSQATLAYQIMLTDTGEDELFQSLYEKNIEELWVDNGEKGWRGPYVKDKYIPLKDAWGNQIKVNYSLIIISAGPDGKFDTVDDIQNKISPVPSDGG